MVGGVEIEKKTIKYGMCYASLPSSDFFWVIFSFFFKVTPSIICIVDQMGMDILYVICCGQVGNLKSWKVLTVEIFDF